MMKVLNLSAIVGSKRMFAVCWLTFFSLTSSLFAVPAYPKIVEYKQVNGETIPICLKGDEFFKYAISEDGYTLLTDSKGNYCYANTNSVGDLVSSGVIAKSVENRSDGDKSYLSRLSKKMAFSRSQKTARQKTVSDMKKQMSAQKVFPTKGSRKLLCILVEFTDVKFTLSQSSFNSLFNASDYSTGGAHGSVKEYFDEVSYGQLSLQTKVVGPYTVSKPMAHYGANLISGNDSNPQELAREACLAANGDVDFSDYDNDGDGYVDGIHVIYAGYDESVGGSANAIWAHKWVLASYLQLDGVVVSTYSCSSELRGTSGSGITMPGVVCHEFGHVLGAPDFYDVDYEVYGEYDGTGEWDLQAQGNWNGSPQGACPAHPNPYTKAYIYGWTTVTTLDSTQSVTINPSASNKNAFYRVDTSTDGEFYLFENRQQIGFDAGLPGYGLMIYHGTSSSEADAMNSTHPQNFYPVAANGTYALPTGLGTYGAINSSTCPWPTGTKTSFSYESTPSLRSWAGSKTGCSLSNIKKNGSGSSGTVSFSFTGTGSTSTSNIDLRPYQPAEWDDCMVVSTVEDVTSSSASFTSQDTIYAKFAIANFDENDSAGFNFSLYIDDVLYQTARCDEGVHSLKYSWWTAIIDPLSAGTHTLRLVIDSDNEIAETDESNNSYSKTIMVTSGVTPPTTESLPNLRIQSVSLKPSVISSSQESTITFVVTNSGAVAASPCVIGVSLNDQRVPSLDVTTSSISAQRSATYQMKLSMSAYDELVVGENKITFYVDINDVVEEEKEYDNEFSTSSLTITGTAGTLSAPTGVAATQDREDGVYISWNPVSGAGSYEIYRSTSEFPSSMVDSFVGFVVAKIAADVTSTSYFDQDSTLVAGTTYYYYVRAVNTAQKSAYSEPVAGMKKAQPQPDIVLSTPQGVSASIGTYTDKVVVKWASVSGATSYTVYRGSSVLQSGVTGTSYTDTTAVAGTSYTYKVKAVNSAGESELSTSVSGYRSLTITSTSTINVAIPKAGGTVTSSGIDNPSGASYKFLSVNRPAWIENLRFQSTSPNISMGFGTNGVSSVNWSGSATLTVTAAANSGATRSWTMMIQYGTGTQINVVFTQEGTSTVVDNYWTTEPSIANWTYGSTASTPVAASKYGAWTVTYDGSTVKPTNAGTYTATFSVPASSTYGALSKTVQFTIRRRTLTSSMVTLSSSSFVYDGTAKKPTVNVSDGGLITSSDYAISYADNVNPGTATVTITGKRNYTGTVRKTFTIEEAESQIPWLYAIGNGGVTITGYDGEVPGELVIPDTIDGVAVVGIGESAFEDGVDIISVTIPDSVTTIGAKAFCWCENLERVTMGNGVTSLGNYAFRACGLTTIDIPDSVATVGTKVFQGCDLLETIYVSADFSEANCTKLQDGNDATIVRRAGVDPNILFETTAEGLVVSGYNGTVPDSLVIPAKKDGVAVVGIKASAFEDCDTLVSVTIPDSVTTIGDGAFYWCVSLEQVSFGKGLTTIGNNAFRACEALKTVTIPASVTSIGTRVFQGCDALTDIYITESQSGFADALKYGNDAVVHIGSGTSTTGGVPHDWIDDYKSNPAFAAAVAAAGGDYEKLAQIKGLNGYTFEECYIIGIEPTEADAKFEASIEIVNGKPVITYEPNLGQKRKYVIEGCAELGGAWKVINSDTDKAGMHFFKVKVSLP